ncbi:MAG: glycosyltransferase [Candidatus Pacearchaeota archaeon]
MKIALFHPWIKSKGGAERVVLEFLKNTEHDVDVYTWIYDEKNTFDEFKKFKINVVAPKFAKKLARYYILRGLFFLIALFSKIPLEKYDAFLISTGGLAEFVTFRNYIPNRTYAYVHTILRATYKEDIKWNLKYRYKNPFSKLVYLLAAYIYKFFEKKAWKRIDVVIFNSELSLKRAREHNLIKGKKVYIVYPPVNIEKFRKIKIKKGDFFLYPARFNMSKRQDILLKAWEKFVKKYPNYKLILVGNIENKKYFEKIKKEANEILNVEIKTNISDKELLKLYAGCLAVIFIPFMEDFGIVPFEAMVVGKPLIAVNKGGYVNLIKKYYNSNTVWIKENEKNFVENIMESLEKFFKKNPVGKKISLIEINDKNFAKKIDYILECKI